MTNIDRLVQDALDALVPPLAAIRPDWSEVLRRAGVWGVDRGWGTRPLWGRAVLCRPQRLAVEVSIVAGGVSGWGTRPL